MRGEERERRRGGKREGERQWGGGKEGGWARTSAIRCKLRANVPLLLYIGAGRLHKIGRTRWPIGVLLIVFSLTKTNYILSELV